MKRTVCVILFALNVCALQVLCQNNGDFVYPDEYNIWTQKKSPKIQLPQHQHVAQLSTNSRIGGHISISQKSD